MAITDLEARNLQPGRTLSERIGSRGEGTMELVAGKNTKTGFYRYVGPDGKRQRLKLGALTTSNTLRDMRAKCREHASQHRDTPDLKGWREDEEARKRKQDDNGQPCQRQPHGETKARQVEANHPAVGTQRVCPAIPGVQAR